MKTSRAHAEEVASFAHGIVPPSVEALKALIKPVIGFRVSAAWTRPLLGPFAGAGELEGEAGGVAEVAGA